MLDRVETITWQGLSYRAGPVELAFIPKVIACARRPQSLPGHHVEDLRRLAPIVDESFLAELARFRRLRFLGRPLPRRLDPFVSVVDLARSVANAAGRPLSRRAALKVGVKSKVVPARLAAERQR